MAGNFHEYHENVSEYFPMMEKVKGKKKISTTLKALSTLLAVSAAGIAAAIAVVTFVHVFCSPLSISENSAVFDAIIFNADEDSTVRYALIEYEDGFIPYDLIKEAREEAVVTGVMKDKRQEIHLDGLTGGTDYLLIFYEANGQVGQHLLKQLPFSTPAPAVKSTDTDPGAPMQTPDAETGEPTESKPDESEAEPVQDEKTEPKQENEPETEIRQEEESTVNPPEENRERDIQPNDPQKDPPENPPENPAKEETAEYTVSFNMGGHGEAIASQTVKSGETAVDPGNPAEEGCIFGGWYADAAFTTEFDFTGTAITADTTIYAKWDAIKVTVTFNMGVAKENPVPDQEIDYGQSAVDPGEQEFEGYTFEGWYLSLDDSSAYDFSTPVKKDLTLYAKWTIKTFAVSFEMNGYGRAPESQTVAYGDYAADPDFEGEEEAYEFGGWYADEALTTEFIFSETRITEVTTIYAKWTVKEYTVIFEVGSVGEAIEPVQVKHGEAVRRPIEPTSEQYDFVGWYLSLNDSSAYDFNTPVTADLTLYGKWTVKTFTVSFEMNGHGRAPEAQTVAYGDYASKPEAEEEGYKFLGWYVDEGLTTEFDFDSTRITEDTTVYAKWDVVTFRVSFNLGKVEGVSIAGQTVEYGKTAAEPEAPEAEGYTFGGWYADENYNTSFDFAAGITEDTVIYAKWTINEYTVSFDMGGVDAEVASQTVEYRSYAAQPEDPTAEGHEFGGWYANRELTEVFEFTSTPITADTTVYAKWDIIFLTVSFNTMEGKDVVIEDQKVEYGDTAAEPTPPVTREYDFVGWYRSLNDSEPYDFDKAVTESFILYAKWTRKTFTVTFNMNGHGTAPEAQTVEYGNAVRDVEKPEETGYEFVGWYSDATCITPFEFSTGITKDTTVYAKWTAIYTVTFEMNGHGTPPNPQQVKEGATVTNLETPALEAYEFGGWYTDPEFTERFNADTPITKDTTVYARWLYWVDFDSGYVNAVIASQKVQHGGTVNKPEDPSPVDYDFEGWYLSPNDSNPYNFSTPVTDNLVLYAKWTIKMFTVSFDMNGHGTAPDDQTVEYGSSLQRPSDPTAEGFVFGGWYADPEFKTQYDFSRGITEDTTIYAKWTEILEPEGLTPEVIDTWSIDDESAFLMKFGFDPNGISVDQMAGVTIYLNGERYESVDVESYDDGTVGGTIPLYFTENETLTVYGTLDYADDANEMHTVTGPELTIKTGGMGDGTLTVSPAEGADGIYYYSLTVNGIQNGDGEYVVDSVALKVNNGALWVDDAEFSLNNGTLTCSGSFAFDAANVVGEFPVTAAIFGQWKYDWNGDGELEQITDVRREFTAVQKVENGETAPEGRSPQIADIWSADGYVFDIEFPFDLNGIDREQIAFVTVYRKNAESGVYEEYGTIVPEPEPDPEFGDPFEPDASGVIRPMAGVPVGENKTLSVYAVLEYTDGDGNTQSVTGGTLTVDCGGMAGAESRITVERSAESANRFNYTIEISGIKDGDGKYVVDEISIGVINDSWDSIIGDSDCKPTFSQPVDGTMTVTGSFDVITPTVADSFVVYGFAYGHWEYEGYQLQGTSECSFETTYTAD